MRGLVLLLLAILPTGALADDAKVNARFAELSKAFKEVKRSADWEDVKKRRDIVNELAREYGETAHVVKADIGKVPGAIETYKIRSTPTTVVIARPPEKMSKKARKKTQGTKKRTTARPTQRWRASGLVMKDQLERVLESNGARRVEA